MEPANKKCRLETKIEANAAKQDKMVAAQNIVVAYLGIRKDKMEAQFKTSINAGVLKMMVIIAAPGEEDELGPVGRNGTATIISKDVDRMLEDRIDPVGESVNPIGDGSVPR